MDLALFTIGINTNLRASDMLQIRVKQVKTCKPMDEIVIAKEKKTGKCRKINLNKACIDAINGWLQFNAGKKLRDDDFLFTGKRGTVIGVPAINLKVKRWCAAIRLKGNFGSHTLRKTFGYHKRLASVDIPTLMVCFNHSNQRQTLDYLCIQLGEIKNVYEGII